MTAEEVHELVEVINTMSGSNVIAKIDAQNARLDALVESMNAKLDSQTSKYTPLITIVSIVGGLVSLILAYGTFFAGQ